MTDDERDDVLFEENMRAAEDMIATAIVFAYRSRCSIQMDDPKYVKAMEVVVDLERVRATISTKNIKKLLGK